VETFAASTPLGGATTRPDASPPPASATRHVIIEFDSYEQALACYRNASYQDAAKPRRASAATDLIIGEGLAPLAGR